MEENDDFGVAAIIGVILAFIAAVMLSILAFALVADIAWRQWKHKKRVYMIR